MYIDAFFKKGNDFYSYKSEFLISDPNYIEGALVISDGSTVVLGKDHWDLVDQTVSYLIDSLIELLGGESSSAFMLPDQPIEVVLYKIGSENFIISVEGKSISFNVFDFSKCLLDFSKRFFDKITVSSGVNKESYNYSVGALKEALNGR